MKLTIDTSAKLLIQEVGGKSRKIDLYSREAFELISYQWLKVGWDQKYSYAFSWMGRPIIQLPEDIIRTQEVIYQVKPDFIVETGIAHGGSSIFYAALCKAMGKGRVIGIDIDIRAHNRRAIEEHEMSSLITLIEGDSAHPEIVKQVELLIERNKTVMVILDSCHSKEHVLNELEAYHSLVTPGSYIVAADGIVRELHDVPHGSREWSWDNPAEAVNEFVKGHPDFVIEQPLKLYNESGLQTNITYWPGAWLRRK